MEILGNMDIVRNGLVKSAHNLKDGIDSSLEPLRNIKNEAEHLFQNKKEEALEGLDTVRKDIWETLERYL